MPAWEPITEDMDIHVGDQISCTEYGIGVCKKIDEKSKDFHYFCQFLGEKKINGKPDKTLIWLSIKDLVRLGASVLY